jgi:hypothetical protein
MRLSYVKGDFLAAYWTCFLDGAESTHTTSLRLTQAIGRQIFPLELD